MEVQSIGVAPRAPPDSPMMNKERLLILCLACMVSIKCHATCRDLAIADAITLEPVYIGEVFTNTRGGITTKDATRYQGLLDLRCTVDLDQTRLPLPGRFVLLAQNTHGRGLTRGIIGDTLVLSNIDSESNIAQVSEYWWEFSLFNERLDVRLGKQDLNTEFLVMDLAADFIQSSFGLSPSTGFPSYPNPSMAAILRLNLSEDAAVKAGIWDTLADGGSWGFSDNEITFTIGEFEFRYALDRGRLPGILDVGIAYQSEGVVGGVISQSSGYGYYIQIEQLVFREHGSRPEDGQGLGVFCSYFPRFGSGLVVSSAIDNSVVCGLVYKGLIPKRDDDVVGAGFAWASLNRGGRNKETVTEVFYKAKLSPTLSIQPDLQYIGSPSGIFPDSLAVGLRFILSP